jgi:hypothetical protein
MPDWKTRLAVSYSDADGNTVDITPIDSFAPSFSISAEAMHSIEDTHIGVIYSPEQMTFSITVKAIGDVAAKLTALAMNGTYFNITLQEQTGDDWSFTSIVMSDCIITSAAPTNASPTGAPTATFSGFSLGAKATDKSSTSVELPA